MGKAELKVEIDADLLAQARAAGVDIARTLEAELRRVVPPADNEAKARRWAEVNADALAAQLERIDAHGVFGADLRTW
jgi:post-segregation antitoxin (ccd killing protein)